MKKILMLIFILNAVACAGVNSTTNSKEYSYVDQCKQFYAGGEEQLIRSNNIGATLDTYCSCYSKEVSILPSETRADYLEIMEKIITLRKEGNLSIDAAEEILIEATKAPIENYPLDRNTLSNFEKFTDTLYSKIRKGYECEDTEPSKLQLLCEQIITHDSVKEKPFDETVWTYKEYCSCYNKITRDYAEEEKTFNEKVLNNVISAQKNSSSLKSALAKVYSEAEESTKTQFAYALGDFDSIKSYRTSEGYCVVPQ